MATDPWQEPSTQATFIVFTDFEAIFFQHIKSEMVKELSEVWLNPLWMVVSVTTINRRDVRSNN